MTTPNQPAASERIEAAAIISKCGDVVQLPRPARHHSIIAHMIDKGEGAPVTGSQGFVTDSGRFVTRREAMWIAITARQVKHNETIHPTDLFTEDLW